MFTDFLPLLAVFLVVLLLLGYPLGLFMARVADAGAVPGMRWLARGEALFYRAAGEGSTAAQGWKAYALALVAFNAVGALAVYLLQRVQGWLPLNPANLPNVGADSSFNTAVSFVANTNWQGYSGEQTMSILTQMLALAGQNFFSAATGIAVAFALIRGFASCSSKSIGNFWVDLTRSTLYILLPLSLVWAVFFASQGVVQNFSGQVEAQVLDPTSYTLPDGGAARATTQVIPMGPVASQEAIKLLGTNGGGYFNANSAHPFENPNALTNFVQTVGIFLIPAGLCFSFGRMVGDMRQGWAVLATMSILFVAAATLAYAAEQQANPVLAALGVDASGGNMEGKETRFGIAASSLFAAVTTAASCGAVNAMHDSFMPLGGMVPMVLMQLGEGIDFIGDVRKWSAVPIIVLSARTMESEKIRALDAGADDYLAKPFGTGEMLARVRATLRRQRQPAERGDGSVRFGAVSVHPHERTVTRDGKHVHLTPTEYRLLAVLAGNAGRVMTNPQLLRAVWGPGHAESGHYLRIYMGHLRHKLEEDPAQPRHLLTETGVGYRLWLGQ